MAEHLYQGVSQLCLAKLYRGPYTNARVLSVSYPVANVHKANLRTYIVYNNDTGTFVLIT